MTNFEINFNKIVSYIDGFALNIVEVPISQIFHDIYEPGHVTVTIDPDWKDTNFGTIKDNNDYAWLFPISKKDVIIDNLKAKYLL